MTASNGKKGVSKPRKKKTGAAASSRTKSRSTNRKPPQKLRKKQVSKSFRYLFMFLILAVVFLASTIVILDQRAMKRGHIGLWETLVGITPAISTEDVSYSLDRVLKGIGSTSLVLTHDGHTIISNTEQLHVVHQVFTVSDEKTFEQIVTEFDQQVRREGVNIFRRHSIRNPGEWLQTYYIGTHAGITHKIDLYYYPTELPTPVVDPDPPPPQPDDENFDTSLQPSIALIFDDFGPNEAIAHRFLTELNVPITIAVLPWQPFSNEIISMTNQADQTAFLHAPMEPHNPAAMGNMADQYLMTWMDGSTLREQTVLMLNDHRGVIGVNNHTGSKMTENRRAMQVFLSEIKKRNLIFIDSRTTADSVAEEVARALSIPTASRHVFIDQGYDGGDVRANMRLLADMAKRNGSAIGIGHAIDSTLDQVKDVLPEILQDGIQVVPIESLVN